MSSRNEKKWAPFESLFRTKDFLEELEGKKHLVSKPTLSLDELEVLEKKILEAYHTHSPIKIKYFYNGHYFTKIGIISNLSKVSCQVYFLDHTSLYFDQILDLSFI